MICPTCNNKVKKNSKSCDKCGFSFTKDKSHSFKCKKCGGELKPGAKYCLRCGKTVDKVSFMKTHIGRVCIIIMDYNPMMVNYYIQYMTVSREDCSSVVAAYNDVLLHIKDTQSVAVGKDIDLAHFWYFILAVENNDRSV